MIDDNFIKNHTLLECLQEFKGASDGKTVQEREESLSKIFESLAKKFIYGGYILVGKYYRIEIKTVEFYYHEEDEYENSISDPMVYHRNNKFPNRIVPPFPIMTLHSHWSGFDITFEDPNGKYRASALIRAYAVYDIKGNGYVKLDTRTNTDKQDKIVGLYNLQEKPYIDTRSTYLQYYLNGFNLVEGKSTRIIWKDDVREGYGDVKSLLRKNVEPKRHWAFKSE